MKPAELEIILPSGSRTTQVVEFDNGGCMPETCYFVQMLKEGILFDKWIDVKGFASKKKAQEFKKMLES